MLKNIKHILIIALFGILVSSGIAVAEEAPITITITGIEGTVLVKIQPSTEWVPAQVGQVLQQNDGIKTLADGIAHLKLDNKIGFLLKPNSEFIVEVPLVAEPYTEAAGAGDTADTVYAPEVNQEPAASTI